MSLVTLGKKVHISHKEKVQCHCMLGWGAVTPPALKSGPHQRAAVEGSGGL